MQIHLFAIIDSVPLHATLPAPEGWGIKADRIQSKKRTLTGTYITQFSQRAAADFDAAYDSQVDIDQAAIAEIIDNNLATTEKCYLTHGKMVFEVIPDIALGLATSRKTRVSGSFSITRRVV